MDDHSDEVMKTWAWTALNESTGRKFGLYATEKEAADDAERRTRRTRNLHTAQQMDINPVLVVRNEVRCDRCGDRIPVADGLVATADEEFACGPCSPSAPGFVMPVISSPAR
jgi:hypothetical protein